MHNKHNSKIGEVHECMVLGESAIQEPEPTYRNVSVRVVSAEMVCLKLSKESYHGILADLSLIRKAKRYKFLQEVLKFTPETRLYDINTAISEITYQAGETIYHLGHDTTTFYLI